MLITQANRGQHFSGVSLVQILMRSPFNQTVAFSRWHVEKWFERAKQECSLGAFEVRTYTSLIRHWLASRLAMFFLADYSGTSGRCGQYADMESVAKISVFMETTERAVPILSGA